MLKRVPLYFALLCLVIMALPFWAMPFAGETANQELREPADAPQIIRSGSLNRSFAEEFDEWFSDRFAYRQMLISLNALINVKLLRASPVENVIMGRDGMYFFDETLPDFTDANPLTDDELRLINENITMLAMSVRQRGGRLFIAVAPNKNSLYPENMPPGYIYIARNTRGNIERLERAVSGTGAEWIDLLAPLQTAKADGQVYYATDTHWNEPGAYAAAKVILAAMGRECPDYPDGKEIEYSGDLARMMGLAGMLTEQVISLTGPGTDGPDYSEHYAEALGSGDGALLMLRDSFGTTIAPFITDVYESAILRWEKPLSALEEADDVLLLIAERNIRFYLLGAPTCVAPVVSAQAPDDTRGCEAEAYSEGGMVYIEFRFAGEAPERAFLLLDGEALWAAPATDASEPGWFRAVLPADELYPDMALRAFSDAYASEEAWILGDLVDLDTGDESDDDMEWLRQLRELDEDGED